MFAIDNIELVSFCYLYNPYQFFSNLNLLASVNVCVLILGCANMVVTLATPLGCLVNTT